MTCHPSRRQTHSAGSVLCRGLGRSLVASLALLLAGSGAGCNIVGALASRVVPPEKIPAEFTLPEQPTLILVVEHGVSGTDVTQDEMAQSLAEEFREHKLPPTVPTEAVYRLRTGRPTQFSRLSPAELAKALGAKQVLYVDLENVRVETATGSEMTQGKVSARVKVIDAATNLNLWPTDQPSHLVSGQSEYVQLSQSTEDQVRRGLMRNVAFQIARLFYTHAEEYESDRKGPQ